MTRASPIPERAWPRDGALRAWLAARSGGARLHAGVDLGWRGDVVRAPEGGIVDVIGRASYGDDTPRTSTPIGWAGYGPFLVVLHGDSGWYHLLAHVVDPSVTLGQRVELGRAIARVSERGDHLHWEVRTRRKPPSGWATVEVTDDPAAWLELERRPWTHSLGCPLTPVADRRTPRECRPGWVPSSSSSREDEPEPRPPARPAARPTRAPQLVDELGATTTAERVGCSPASPPPCLFSSIGSNKPPRLERSEFPRTHAALRRFKQQ